MALLSETARWSIPLLPCVLACSCMLHAGFDRCAEGHALSDGQCVPTSSIVFRSCIDSFRKSSVQTEEGVDAQLGANIGGYGGRLRHARTDKRASSYASLPDEVVPEAIAECRRQEEAEREQQVQKAWKAADAARARAVQAEADVRAAKRAHDETVATLDLEIGTREGAERERDELSVALLQLQARFDEQARLVAEKHPCTAEDWARCAEQALDAKRSGDYDRAHELYRLSCDGGEGGACGNWGVMFEHGLGVPVSARLARARYAAGCDLEDPRACFNEARMLDQTGDVTGAAEHFALACEAGEMEACARLGRIEELGTGVDVDLEAARRHYAAACDVGRADACTGLAGLFERGLGVDLDQARAASLYERACEAGESEACRGAERLSRRWESVPTAATP